MAPNFKIIKNQNSNSLHLKLFGGFDGASAFELINTISDFNKHEEKIIIHTDGLNYIDPFGKEFFVNKIQGAGRLHLVFTGRHADTFF